MLKSTLSQDFLFLNFFDVIKSFENDKSAKTAVLIDAAVGGVFVYGSS